MAMKNLLIVALVALTGCASVYKEALDQVQPASVKNPLLAAGAPFCADGLTDAQTERMRLAVRRWDEALPFLSVRFVEKCLPGMMPVRVAPDEVPSGMCGYTTITKSGVTVLFLDDRCLRNDNCTAEHEIGHAICLGPHADPGEPPSPMSDGPRPEDCRPSAADVAIVRRTYLGKWNL